MGKLAFLFAGQGSQYPGMGKDLYEQLPSVKKLFDLADSLRPGILNTLFHADADALKLTINTQPCVYLLDLACAYALRDAGIVADGAAGFSLGEIAAACYTGVFSEKDGFLAVLKRAELMQAAAEENPGAMSAILKLNDERVLQLAQKVPGAYPVNFNCPGQIVVAGSEEALALFEERATQEGGRALRLKVSGAFHSPHMAKASRGFYSYLSGIHLNTPSMPLYANASAAPYASDMQLLLSSQIMQPVLWQQTIQNMVKDGFDRFVELGPGKTLSGLVQKIGGSKMITNIQNYSDIAKVLGTLEGDTNDQQ